MSTTLKQFISKLATVTLLAGMIMPFTFSALADETGTVTVSTNRNSGAYTIRKIDNSIVGMGSGLTPTIHLLDASPAPGTGYKIVYEMVAGSDFPDPNPHYFNLVTGASLTFGPSQSGSFQSGVYTTTGGGGSGVVRISTNSASGNYKIYSATDAANTNSFGSGGGLNETIHNLPASPAPGTGYKIVFGPVTDFLDPDPNPFFFNLIENSDVTYGPNEPGEFRTGVYTSRTPSATVRISTNNASGNYKIYSATDAANTNSFGSGDGLNETIHNLPASPAPGTGYKIVFGSAGIDFLDPDPNPFFFNLIENTDVTYGPNENGAFQTGVYTPVGAAPTERVFVRTSHPFGSYSYSIFTATGTTAIATGSGDTFTPFDLEATASPGSGYRIEFGTVTGLITPSDINFNLIENGPLNPQYFTGIYRANSSTGSLSVTVIDENNSLITDGDWELKVCSGPLPTDCTTTLGLGGGDAVFPDVAPGSYRLFANAAPGYANVQILTTNPFDLTAGGSHDFLVQYSTQASVDFADPRIISKTADNLTPEPVVDVITYTVAYENTGNLDATNVVFTDTLNANLTYVPASLSDANCALVGTEIICNFASIPATSGPLSFTYQATVNAGVADATAIINTISITAAYENADTNNDSANETVIVTVPTPTGTITLSLLDTTAAQVGDDWRLYAGTDNTGALYANGNGSADSTTEPLFANAPIGDYFLEIDNIGGFLSAVISPADTQNLVDAGNITFDVLYTPVPNTGTIAINLLDTTAAQVGDDWRLYSGTDNTGTLYANGNGSADSTTEALFANAPIGDYFLEIDNIGGFQTAVITSANPQNLVDAGNITFDVLYTPSEAAPDLTLTHTAVANAQSGDTINYTITYGNDGALANATATNAVIVVNTDPNLENIVAAGCTIDIIASTITCNVGDLANGVSGLTISYSAQVLAGLANGTLISNVATITATEIDADVTNNADNADTLVTAPEITLTKTVSQSAGLQGGERLTYTITVTRTDTVLIDNNFVVSDIIDAGIIGGSNGGRVIAVQGNGTCEVTVSPGGAVGGGGCLSDQIDQGPITITLLAIGSTATITYEAIASAFGIPFSQSAIVTNTTTAVDANNVTAPVSAQAPVTISQVTVAPGTTTGGSTGSTSGGGGGSLVMTGEMQLDITKLVSFDGVNYSDVSAVAVPENTSTRLFSKVVIFNLGDVSATDITLRHFFETGNSDITAGPIENLVGAHFDNDGNIVVDKVIVGKPYEFSYSILVHENGQNINPAMDGLELISFGSKLSNFQDALTYLGLGDQIITYLYAGQIPAGVLEGLTDPVTTTMPSIPSALSIDVRTDLTAAAVGDTVNLTITLENLTSKDMTSLFINHDFDPNAFEVLNTFGGKNNGQNVEWIRSILRPGQVITLNLTLKVKDGAPIGEMVRGLTRVLMSEFANIAPFENFIQLIGGPATSADPSLPFELVATGPMGTLTLLLILSILGYFGSNSVRHQLYLRKKRLALQSI